MKISELQKSDPAKFCTDKFTSHSYGEFYDALFAGKEHANLHILEIGVNEGGSVRLWHDYLKKSEIVGVDTVDLIHDSEKKYDRLEIEIFDAYNPENLLLFFWGGRFDVVIDDGPHTLSSQIYALTEFPSYLKPGGILVIEDVPEGAEQEIIKYAPAGGTVEVINLRSVKGRWDDCLIVFKKRLK
jgi:23S rRNA U2552 (ribose-2'-O)-methylase RlmE/FtsJ